MPTNVSDIRVFIASPSGLEQERNAFRDVVLEFNDLDLKSRKAIFTAVGWEETLGGHGKRPQDLINEDIAACDYMVLILSDRWGTPPDESGRYSSGTEEEFHVGLSYLNDPMYPMKQIVVFFKDEPLKNKNDPGPQLSKVIRFKRQLEDGKEHLYMTFADVSQLQKRLRQFLVLWSQDSRNLTTQRMDLVATV